MSELSNRETEAKGEAGVGGQKKRQGLMWQR